MMKHIRVSERLTWPNIETLKWLVHWASEPTEPKSHSHWTSLNLNHHPRARWRQANKPTSTIDRSLLRARCHILPHFLSIDYIWCYPASAFRTGFSVSCRNHRPFSSFGQWLRLVSSLHASYGYYDYYGYYGRYGWLLPRSRRPNGLGLLKHEHGHLHWHGLGLASLSEIDSRMASHCGEYLCLRRS